MHSIKSTRCFHSYPTNLNKTVSNTIFLKNATSGITFLNFYPLHLRTAPQCGRHLHTSSQISDKHSGEDNSKYPCCSTVLQAGDWAQPRVPPHFPGGNLITAGASFCSHTNPAHDNPPSYGISPFASFTLPTSPASSLGARGCRKGGMLQKLPSVSKRLNKIRGWSYRLLLNHESNRDQTVQNLNRYCTPLLLNPREGLQRLNFCSSTFTFSDYGFRKWCLSGGFKIQ